MLKIHKQNLAEEDLIDIWLYSFENFGVIQADKYLDVLDGAIKNIASNPKLGVNADYIRNGYRKLQINEHLIFYQIADIKFTIIRILGNDMDYSIHL